MMQTLMIRNEYLIVMLGSRVPAELCVACKGTRKLCGASICPILVKQKHLIEELPIIRKTTILGTTPPNILVGEYGYPRINVGPISTYQPEKNIGDPSVWAMKNFDLIDILKIRLSMLYSFQQQKITVVRRPDNKLKEVVISLRPIDVEVLLKKEPHIKVRLDADIPPVGSSAPLKDLEVVSNPLTSRKVENAIEEDVKAAIVLPELYQYGYNYYYLQQLFSAGLLGVKSRRRLVPTRWSITATDTILGNFFLKNIKKYQSISEAELYFREYLGNKYYIVLIPSDYWSMEMFEIWLPFSVWVRYSRKPIIIHIYENYDGKPNK